MNHGSPEVSVIIPVYNNPSGLQKTIASLLKQTANSKEYEVIIVDNKSTDNTLEIAQEFETNHENIHVLVENEIQSSYAARNRGIQKSRGELLAFIDADMTVHESWLRKIRESMANHEFPYFGCNVEVVIRDDQRGLVAEFNQKMRFPISSFIENDNFAPTCCLVVRRWLFDEVGLFNECFISGGDMEFGHRVHHAGFKQKFESDITMYHPARSSLRDALSKMFRVGRGLAQYRNFHPNRFEKRIWMRPGSYLPPQPLRFHQKLKQKDSTVTVSKIVGFYALAYLVRLSRLTGAAYQMFIEKFRKRI